MVSCAPPTTMHTMVEMAATEIHGNAALIFATTRGISMPMRMPATTGMSTTFTMDHAMAEAETGMYSPASHKVSNGVRTGANRVEMDVMVTDKATSPRAR